MADGVLMTWGDFRFEVAWGAYQELSRSTAFQWAMQPLVGQPNDRQFMGLASDTITIQGTLYTSFRGGPKNIEALRAQGGKGKPAILTDGRGNVYGKWVLLNVTERHTKLIANGAPAKVEFTGKFEYYGSS
ncbi:phage tail protein [Kordiimonas marina]|uniref:phage tail protein n=1 Tax=Kordiimonas marina TaxID=2872312 RepID=UPI001FF2A72A|nr:phage tail protein [Kordiimonas marina]MCJ9428536.1 phage tail protein [Kordiimonas marina]